MPDEISVSLRPLGQVVVVDLAGDLTAFSEPTVLGAYKNAAGGARAILLNFTGVPYINSGGIAVVIDILTQARRSGHRILITGLTPHYAKVFTMVGVRKFAQFYGSEGEALEAAGRA